MKHTQYTWVMSQLSKNGKVSRNQALKRYISRLGAYISDLNRAGFNITGEYVKTKNGKDYVYYLKSSACLACRKND
jgi:Helix-turn-helix domain